VAQIVEWGREAKERAAVEELRAQRLAERDTLLFVLKGAPRSRLSVVR